MNVLCSNCHKLVGTPENHTDPNLGPLLCPDCGDTFIAEYGGVSLGETLDQFEEPRIVFDGDLHVVACNRSGRRLANATGSRPYGLKSGDFMSCHNASAGCGQSPECPQCSIRGSVKETLKTGKSIENAPAYFTSTGREGTYTRAWGISTRKVGETVHFILRHPFTPTPLPRFRRV
jgi:DNA-directed RNA polymerase subunit RPC12/RpoP